MSIVVDDNFTGLNATSGLNDRTPNLINTLLTTWSGTNEGAGTITPQPTGGADGGWLQVDTAEIGAINLGAGNGKTIASFFSGYPTNSTLVILARGSDNKMLTAYGAYIVPVNGSGGALRMYRYNASRAGGENITTACTAGSGVTIGAQSATGGGINFTDPENCTFSIKVEGSSNPTITIAKESGVNAGILLTCVDSAANQISNGVFWGIGAITNNNQIRRMQFDDLAAGGGGGGFPTGGGALIVGDPRLLRGLLA